jgi:hypothetical protein
MNPPPLFTTKFQYLDERYKDAKVALQSLPEEGGKRGDSVGFDVPVFDGRVDKLQSTAQLERRGFCLATLTNEEYSLANKIDTTQLGQESGLINLYFQAIEQCVQRITGAAYVRAFNYVNRNSTSETFGVHTLANSTTAARGPVNDVHCDFAHDRALTVRQVKGLRSSLGLEKCRFTLMNCWRNTVQGSPVVHWPMAFCDISTIRPNDLVPRVSPENGNTIYNLLKNQMHAWYTFPEVTDREVLLFRQYDTASHVPTPHTAFDSPQTPIGAPPRYSCEVRCVCFFADDERVRTDKSMRGSLLALQQSGKGTVRPGLVVNEDDGGSEVVAKL